MAQFSLDWCTLSRTKLTFLSTLILTSATPLTSKVPTTTKLSDNFSNFSNSGMKVKFKIKSYLGSIPSTIFQTFEMWQMWNGWRKILLGVKIQSRQKFYFFAATLKSKVYSWNWLSIVTNCIALNEVPLAMTHFFQIVSCDNQTRTWFICAYDSDPWCNLLR